MVPSCDGVSATIDVDVGVVRCYVYAVGFRRKSNRHDRWSALVEENVELLADVPREALIRELAFRDYVTGGVHRGVRFSPSVLDLSAEALDRLWTFIQHRAQFDMDASLFDDFNEAFRRAHAHE